MRQPGAPETKRRFTPAHSARATRLATFVEALQRGCSEQSVASGRWPVSRCVGEAIRASGPVVRRRALKELSFRLPCRPLLRFLYMYVLRLGFLDGLPGYYYCRFRRKSRKLKVESGKAGMDFCFLISLFQLCSKET